MIRKEHRYTGEWPPLDVLRKYPNWEHALDEESVEGQDETTTRPENKQAYITKNTAFTAGKVVQADSTVRDAILEVINGEIYSVDVFIDRIKTWRVVRLPAGWQPFDQNWLPEEERMPVVSFKDTSIFPLHVSSVLPFKKTKIPLQFTVEP